MQIGTLKDGDQAKINTVIANFGKTQANVMKYSEVFMMLLDRCIFSFKFTFTNFHQIFLMALKVKNKKDLGKEQLQGEKILGREQFIFLLNEIAKVLYKHIPNSQEKFYNEFLSQKFDVNEGQFHSSRVPVFDDINRKLFMEECISSLIQYEQELKNIYVMYIAENYFAMKKSRRLLLNEREIRLQNKKWNFPSVILYLRESETTPHLITIDHAQDILRQIVPHSNSKQQQFYSRHVIVDTYHKEAEGNESLSHLGDPGLQFHEFMLYIGRLAWQTFPKQIEKKSMQQIIERYFNYTFFRNNQNINKTPLPQMNRKMIKKMIEFYKIIETASYQQGKGLKDSKSDLQNPVNLLIQRINKEVINAPDLHVDFNDIVKNLQKEIPKLPAKPVIVQECPPPYKKADAFTIGQQPPPQPVDKDKGAKAEKKSGGGKKDEIPPRVFQWADVPKAKYAIEDHLKEIEHKITFEVKPLTDIQRGQIKKQSYPVIMGQTLFPGELPKNVVPYLKEASEALNDRNFVLALQCYEKGLKEWKYSQVDFDAPAELFFQYSKGNVYLSIGKIEYALHSFYNCRKFADTSRLPFINPDRSLPYFGLGQVFYEMEEYEMSARCFLKARQIRESVLGLEHVQTATAFNNLACCYFMLNRAQQALGYIEIAQVVLDTQLGEHHERTMVSRSNLKKISHGTYDNQPEYRRFWQVFEEDKFEKKKKKKAKDGKKK